MGEVSSTSGVGNLPPVINTNNKDSNPTEVSTGIKVGAFLAMGVLIAGLVSTFFGHAHVADDGSDIFSNPFFNVGIAATVIGGVGALALAYVQYNREKEMQKADAQEVKEGWRRGLQVLGNALKKYIGDPVMFTGRTIKSYVQKPAYLALTLLLIGAVAITFAKLHENNVGTGADTDYHAIILGGVSTGLGVMLGVIAAIIYFKNKESDEVDSNVKKVEDLTKPLEAEVPKTEETTLR